MAGVNEDEQIEGPALLFPPHRLGEPCDDLIIVDDPGVALEIGGRESPDPSQGLARWTGWQTERRIDGVGQSNDRVQIHIGRRSCSISRWAVDRPTLLAAQESLGGGTATRGGPSAAFQRGDWIIQGVALSIAGLCPTLATSGPLPNGPDWSFEPKWDGFRGMPVVDSTVRLLSRRGNDLTYLCPSVEQLHAHAFGPAVFDGEIVAFRDGVQSFEGLQSAMRRRSSEAVAFLPFDVLGVRGISLIDRPYAERRAVLEELEFPDGISITPRFDDGAALFEATR